MIENPNGVAMVAAGMVAGRPPMADVASVADVLQQPWRRWAWTPSSPPFPARDGQRCVWHTLEVAARGSAPVSAPVCLRGHGDRVSAAIRAAGRWEDCGPLSDLWQRRVSGPANESDLFVDVGANIGACTIEMLLTTGARAIVFEPSPSNLFYLTQSLHRMAQRQPAIRRRVVVLPFAAAESAHRATLYVARGNPGNSVVGARIADHRGQDFNETYTIRTARLDAVLGSLLPLRLLKLDVQGYECRALDGISALARSGRLAMTKLEVSERWLFRQGCSSTQLVAVLRSLDFAVGSAGLSLPSCFTHAWYGCDSNGSQIEHAAHPPLTRSSSPARDAYPPTAVSTPIPSVSHAPFTPTPMFTPTPSVSHAPLCRRVLIAASRVAVVTVHTSALPREASARSCRWARAAACTCTRTFHMKHAHAHAHST